MAHCQVLQEYSLFVDMVRQEAKETNDIAAAVTKAVDICISQGILKDYLLIRKSEVIDMVLTEYDEKKHWQLSPEKSMKKAVQKVI